MGSGRKLKILARVALLLSACLVAGCAGRTAMPRAIAMSGNTPDSDNQTLGSGDMSMTVIIEASRPVTQTPGVLSINGLALASPLAEPDAPGPASVPTSYFGGNTGGMPHKLLLGSAPSPTPDDLCAYGSGAERCFTDSSRKGRRLFIADPLNPGHFRETRPGDDKIVEHQIQMEKLVRQHLFWLEK